MKETKTTEKKESVQSSAREINQSIASEIKRLELEITRQELRNKLEVLKVKCGIVHGGCIMVLDIPENRPSFFGSLFDKKQK